MIDIYDTEMIAIDNGPVAWMARQQGSAMSLESFRRGAEEQFAAVGFDATVKAYTTSEAGTFAFDVEINGRIDKGHKFDFDRMVHEITNNVLDDPDQEKGFINTIAAEKQFRADNPDRRGPNHGHGPGACTC